MVADGGDIVAIARDLCAVPLGAFTAERTARARAARSGGDRELAARITALPKPSAAAWLVDRFVREDPEDLARVLDLGTRIRQEQEAPDRTRLRELGTERRALLTELTDGAADRAEQDGKRPSDAVLEEFQQTLLAAMADEDAAVAVRTARLVRSLVVEGLDPVDLGGAVAIAERLDAADGAPSAPRRRRPVEEEPAEDDGRAERERLRAEAEATAAAAERDARTAQRAATDAADRAEEAETAVQERRSALEDLRAQVQQAEADLAAAQEESTTARAEAEDAAQAAATAQETAGAAAAALDRLRD